VVVTSFVPAVAYKALGKLPTTLTTGSTKWLKVLALANIYIDQWQDEPGVDWASLYLPDHSIGTVTASQTFTIDATVRKVSNQESDVVRIIHSDGTTYTDYDIIPNDRVKDYANGMRTFQNNYVSVNGTTLRFNRAFTSTDPQFGGSITVPGYSYAAHISADTDVIPVDIPNWLVFATAAEYIRTDVTRQQQYGNIVAEANQIMQVMKSNNKGQTTRMYQPWRPLGENWAEEAWRN
jgi:hypothetical protein